MHGIHGDRRSVAPNRAYAVHDPLLRGRRAAPSSAAKQRLAGTLLDGFDPATPPPVRWQQLAQRKLPEIDQLAQRASAMKRLLEKGLRCDCVSIEDCVLHDCNPPVALGRRKTN